MQGQIEALERKARVEEARKRRLLRTRGHGGDDSDPDDAATDSASHAGECTPRSAEAAAALAEDEEDEDEDHVLAEARSFSSLADMHASQPDAGAGAAGGVKRIYTDNSAGCSNAVKASACGASAPQQAATPARSTLVGACCQPTSTEAAGEDSVPANKFTLQVCNCSQSTLKDSNMLELVYIFVFILNADLVY